MNKKGFTLVEFVVSFALITTVVILLFQLILSIKTIYLNGNIKVKLLTKQGIMLERIYSDYYGNELTNISNCGNSCIIFTYNNNIEKQLIIRDNNKIIEYDDYAIVLDDNTYIEDITINNKTISSLSELELNDSIFSLHIPIKNSLIDGNFNMDIIFPYKS